MQKVDAEIRRIIDEQYALARKLIEDNRDKVQAMAKALLEWETIDADQIDDIMAGKPPRPPKDWTPSHAPSRRPAAAGGAEPRAGRAPERRLRGCIETGPRGPVLPVHADPHALADHPLPHRSRAAARDGHRQRHARFVFRRRPLSSTRERAIAHCAQLRRRGRRHPRHRRRIDAARRAAGRRSTRSCARVLPVLRGAGDAGRAGLGRHAASPR